MSYSTAPDPPTGLTASLASGGGTTIFVSWTPPSGATGYMIYYEATDDPSDSSSVSVGASITQHNFTNRDSATYTIRIVALSDQLPSTVAQTTTMRGES